MIVLETIGRRVLKIMDGSRQMVGTLECCCVLIEGVR